MKTVMIFGTFDIFHAGHLSLLKQARKHGDQLIAVVARDQTVKRVKRRSAIHTERERKELLEHIDIIDTVILGDVTDVYRVVREMKPAVIVLGYDQRVFADKLPDVIRASSLKTKIIRAKSYQSKKKKTRLIRKTFGLL